METIDDYMGAARARQRLQSDRKLAKALGLQHTTVNHWRTRRTWPSETAMMGLARLAGADEVEAVLLLNIWRSQDTGSRELYTQILEKVKHVAVALFFIATVFGVLSISSPAHAGMAWNGLATGNHQLSGNIYYATI